MEGTGSLEYAKKQAQYWKGRCLESLDKLTMAEESKKDVKLLIDFVVNRKL